MSKKQSSHIRFINHHLPTIESGAYSLEIEPSIEVAGTPNSELANGNVRRQLIVEGPRFQLDPQLVRSVYPAANSTGTYENVFPHIIFNRSTLPWERRIDPQVPNEGTSWLCLLLFDGSEVNTDPKKEIDVSTAQVRSDVKTVGDLPEKLRQNLEISQKPEDKVSVINLPRALLAKAMPKNLENLRLLSHVRHPSEVETETLAGVDEMTIFPMLFASRLPRPNSRSVVYLVSLVGHGDLFSEDGELTTSDPEGVEEFVVLYSWSFTAQGNSGKFHETFENLSDSSSSLHPKPVQNDGANTFLRAGYMPLEHLTRTGNRLVSFYRSPFVPKKSDQPPPFASLATRSADELLSQDATYGMFDVTYAAAWELGRLLTLQNRKVALDLYRWKRHYRQHKRQADDKHGQTADRGHIPHQAKSKPQHDPLPDSVLTWFKELSRFEHIPFNYLVPAAEMLPPESIRLFFFDMKWQAHLLSGAFTIGHVPGGDQDNADQRNLLDAQIEASRRENICGLLIRSSGITDYPHVHIEAFDAAGEFVTPVTQKRLGVDILLLGYPQEIKQITFAQGAEAIHFGLLRLEDPVAEYVKTGSEVAQVFDSGLKEKRFAITDGDLNAEFRNVDFVAVAKAIYGDRPLTKTADTPTADNGVETTDTPTADNEVETADTPTDDNGVETTDTPTDDNGVEAADPPAPIVTKFSPKTGFEAYEVALLMIEGTPKVLIEFSGAPS